MKIYRVGGAVRDRLLGRPVADTDWVVVGGTPDQMEQLGYRPVGRDFPVFLHPQSSEEYALARTERKTGRGYKGFAFDTSPTVTLEADLARRDLTINALAEDENGSIIDPYGGRDDLKQGILRHVSEAFAEDPLRVLRVARFAARFNFRVADATVELMRRIGADGELEHLVPERVWTETERALAEPHARRYFETLAQCDALGRVFPEIAALSGVPQPAKHHPEIDSGLHTLMALEQACRITPDPAVRFAVLVHDLGKGATPRAEWPSHPGHEERGVAMIHVLCDRYRIPNRYRELGVIAARHHLDCHRVAEMKPATVLKKLEEMDAFRRPERFEQFLLACEADARGRKGLEDRPYPQADRFRRLCAAAARADLSGVDLASMGGTDAAATVRERRLDALKQAE
ncbi:MAG: multifunctional CCA addition/repair protein [Gammaproteobacteria bacterium]|nr:multifunctional CCA addition/repair protein [Gammaproteobacteria bacterium]